MNAHPDDVPRIGPGSVVVLAGPDCEYVVIGLQTTAETAVLQLRTADGRPWEWSGRNAGNAP